MRSIFATLLLSLLAFAPSASADGVALVTFTGELVDGESRPISGVFPVQFRIFEAETGGDALWVEARFVSVAEGMYEVQLGANATIPADLYGRTLFVGVELGSAGEVSRTPSTTLPLALIFSSVGWLTVCACAGAVATQARVRPAASAVKVLREIAMSLSPYVLWWQVDESVREKSVGFGDAQITFFSSSGALRAMRSMDSGHRSRLW